MPNNNKTIGDTGEHLAIDYLKKEGISIVTTNFHSRYGEIDIIALDNDTLCFIEVKNYSPRNYISVYHAISKQKKQKIIKTARYYLLKNQVTCPCRFDALLISGKVIEYIKGAFC
ncbi:MAG: YraN family protein [Candidatus Margulisiibacteriota bacterium]|nr:MAG: YraN family protein [Candidatus Margulisbacteria bacterium GWD2_39_127]OGI01565.1 MAG: YraN family protein [Candidatus Margulisbacteria bacterium GWF2_38_17]OGI10006.1 MAG: YraN family protein [Candidatus Margulisbacteria bacterium GWE2_39_32]PZM78261.1 MAG: YraN family protein [Candidatus Margulisiibacteriota bacterium]HAR61851.1 YraN family protein [Candidatus Margulisiibacteriota bacterium]